MHAELVCKGLLAHTRLGEPALDGFEFVMMNPAVSETEFKEVADSVRMWAANGSTATSKNMSMLVRDRRKLMVLQALGDSAVKYGYDIVFPGNPIGFSPTLTDTPR